MRNISLLEHLSSELQGLSKKDKKPFPYADCRKVAGDKKEEFIPDLDLYSSFISGYSNWGIHMLGWTQEKINEVKLIANLPFFEKYPQYMTMEPHITRERTPELYEFLGLIEEMRKKLMFIIDKLDDVTN